MARSISTDVYGIRAYIAEVENVGRRDSGIEAGSELEERLLWAKAYADRTDPINGVDESVKEEEGVLAKWQGHD